MIFLNFPSSSCFRLSTIYPWDRLSEGHAEPFSPTTTRTENNLNFRNKFSSWIPFNRFPFFLIFSAFREISETIRRLLRLISISLSCLEESHHLSKSPPFPSSRCDKRDLLGRTSVLALWETQTTVEHGRRKIVFISSTFPSHILKFYKFAENNSPSGALQLCAADELKGTKTIFQLEIGKKRIKYSWLRDASTFIFVYFVLLSIFHSFLSILRRTIELEETDSSSIVILNVNTNKNIDNIKIAQPQPRRKCTKN